MNLFRILALKLLIALGFTQKPDFVISIVGEHPEPSKMQKGIIYVLVSQGYAKWAYFLCPADVQEVIQLSLMTKHRPYWQLQSDWLGRPSIHPSVWQKAGSYAHFFVRRGMVIWCEDTGK